MTQLSAGWYLDPAGQTRWWDGHQWTEHVGPDPYQQQMLDIAQRNYRGARRVRGLLWTIVGVAVTLFVLLPIGVFLGIYAGSR